MLGHRWAGLQCLGSVQAGPSSLYQVQAKRTRYRKEERPMVKRAVLYARVSGDDRGKDGRNLVLLPHFTK